MPSKASGKFVRDQAAIDQYWQHTTEFGWHSRDHPAFAARAARDSTGMTADTIDQGKNW